MEKDTSVTDRLAWMKINYMKEGMRTSVEAILLVQEHNYPHILLLQIGNTFCKLPGGRLKPGENKIEGLKRKLSSKLAANSPSHQPNWQIGECVAVRWRPNFETIMYPYCPPHMTKPKECKKLFLIHLSERDMTDLASPRTTLAEFTVSSSDRDLLSALAEVIFSCALENTAREHGGGWFQKQRRITSRDSAVCLCRISEGEIVESARRQVGKFDAVKGEMVNKKRKGRHRWWAVPNYTRLDRAGGAGFSAWASVFVHAYRLQIDSGAYKDVEFEGRKKWDDSRAGRASGQSGLISSPGADCCLLKSSEDTKLEAWSVSVIQMIKDDLNWSGNIMFDKNISVWTGILPGMDDSEVGVARPLVPREAKKELRS